MIKVRNSKEVSKFLQQKEKEIMTYFAVMDFDDLNYIGVSPAVLIKNVDRIIRALNIVKRELRK